MDGRTNVVTLSIVLKARMDGEAACDLNGRWEFFDVVLISETFQS